VRLDRLTQTIAVYSYGVTDLDLDLEHLWNSDNQIYHLGAFSRSDDLVLDEWFMDDLFEQVCVSILMPVLWEQFWESVVYRL
jgi:hypothetical protein